MQPAATAAKDYVEAMNAGDIEKMMSLFAPDAVLRHPSGVYADRDSIRSFFIDIAFGNAARL
ncbi:MAG: nuclear transport factor 2 family protein, partial [Myxococcota bacterium]